MTQLKLLGHFLADARDLKGSTKRVEGTEPAHGERGCTGRCECAGGGTDADGVRYWVLDAVRTGGVRRNYGVTVKEVLEWLVTLG